MGSWWVHDGVYDGFMYGASFFWALNLACLALAQKRTVILSFLTKLLTATLKPSRLFLASHKSAQCWHMSSSDRMKFRNVRNAELSSSWLHGQHKPLVVVTRGDSWWLEVAKAPHPSDLVLTVTSCSRQPRREGNTTSDVPWRYAQRSTIRQWLIHTDTE